MRRCLEYCLSSRCPSYHQPCPRTIAIASYCGQGLIDLGSLLNRCLKFAVIAIGSSCCYCTASRTIGFAAAVSGSIGLVFLGLALCRSICNILIVIFVNTWQSRLIDSSHFVGN